jgi:hypothetical protein
MANSSSGRTQRCAFPQKWSSPPGLAIGRCAGLGGWVRFWLNYLVMLVKVPLRCTPSRLSLHWRKREPRRFTKPNFGSSQELTKLVASWRRTRPVKIILQLLEESIECR